MKRFKLIFACVCLVALAQVAWSQDAGVGRRSHGIPGYLDPLTNTFTTRVQGPGTSIGLDPDVTVTNILARLVFKFTISTDQPATAVETCSVTASVFDAAGSYEEHGTALATSAGKACTVTLFFSWPLATPGSDTVSLEYDINSFQPVTVGSVTVAEPLRESDHTIPSIPVPANTQTITTNISATI
jgi:hypothetical protein